MNILWPAMIIISLVAGALNGRLDATVTAGFKAAEGSVMTVLSFAGLMCFWSGILELAEESGICRFTEALLSPVTRRLFPNIERGGKAAVKITSNIAANLLGMGNAATPAGIEAMQELDRINKGGEQPSEEMCLFAVLNTASLQLIPTTVISMRAAAGAAEPAKIIVPVWICSLLSLTAALTAMKLILKFGNKRLPKTGRGTG